MSPCSARPPTGEQLRRNTTCCLPVKLLQTNLHGRKMLHSGLLSFPLAESMCGESFFSPTLLQGFMCEISHTISQMILLVCRFAEAPHDDEDNKRSMVKTPAHMSSCVASSTPLKQPTDKGKPNSVKTAVLSATKTPGAFLLYFRI